MLKDKKDSLMEPILSALNVILIAAPLEQIHETILLEQTRLHNPITLEQAMEMVAMGRFCPH